VLADKRLHLALAQLHRAHKQFGDAQKHYLRAQSYLEHAKALVEWAKTGLPSELDLFVARAALEYVCLQNLKGANMVFRVFLTAFKKDADAAATLKDSPLLNFVRFLLKVVQRDAKPLFLLLRNKYSVALARDAQFEKYLDVIGATYFGIEQTGMAAMLNGLM
jgi:hypothetical protein